MQTFEDTLYTIAHDALRDKFLELFEERKDEINKIINTIFTEELAKDWIAEYIEYGNEFREKIIEMADKEMMGRVQGLFK